MFLLQIIVFVTSQRAATVHLPPHLPRSHALLPCEGLRVVKVLVRIFLFIA